MTAKQQKKDEWDKAFEEYIAALQREGQQAKRVNQLVDAAVTDADGLTASAARDVLKVLSEQSRTLAATFDRLSGELQKIQQGEFGASE